MKEALLIDLIRKIKSSPSLRRKIKIFAVVGFCGFVIFVGLAIWAGVTAVNYTVTAASQVVSSPQAQVQVQTLKSELKDWQFQALPCWLKTQSLMMVTPWLERPALENLRNLKEACLGGRHDSNQI